MFNIQNSATDRSRTAARKSRSLPEMGGSADKTNTAASIVSSAAVAAAAEWANTEPTPGVSTRSIPPSSSGAGICSTTSASPSRLSGLADSVTNPGSSSTGRVSPRPSR